MGKGKGGAGHREARFLPHIASGVNPWEALRGRKWPEVCIDGAEGVCEYRRLRRRVVEQEGERPAVLRG